MVLAWSQVCYKRESHKTTNLYIIGRLCRPPRAASDNYKGWHYVGRKGNSI